MAGLMQIMIYLFCIYLIYKGVEIFQIALMSNVEQKSRPVGILLGVLSIIAAIGIGFIAVVMTDDMAAKIGNNMPR